ncbi:MAG: glycosyltransferase [Hyphomonadaceae bacterium]
MLHEATWRSDRAAGALLEFNAHARPAPLRRIALIGNFPPRRCGIATFTRDLYEALRRAAPLAEASVVAMTDGEHGYAYPDAVTMSPRQHALVDYVRAADRLNHMDADLVSLQHEYGIFGGPAGAHVLTFLARLRAPVVTTLHTVLTHPDPDQRRVMEGLIARSARLIVMAEKGRRILRSVYNTPDDKIAVVPHGVPDCAFEETAAHKAALGFAGRDTLLTFGLLAGNKGIEDMIRALPAIAARHRKALYVVLGATHPHLVAREGEAYRESLVALAADLNVSDHVRFVDEYVDEAKLLAYLAAADVYVTPYLTESQITSGTLSFAVGLGKPVVSTPYWHAQELLAEGRGVLTPFHDPAALAAACDGVLSDAPRREKMRRAAYAAGRAMIWPRVGERYLEIFGEAKAEKRMTRKEPPRRPIPAPHLAGVERLTDGCGILQHSRYRTPDRNHGYCLDDNARALILMNRLGELDFRAARTSELAAVYASFVQHAWRGDARVFRNFMSYDRRWLEPAGSDDSIGRGFWALGDTALRGREEDLRRWAGEIALEALEAAGRLNPPRSRAFACLGLAALAEARPGEGRARALMRRFAQDFLAARESHAGEGWDWFEPWLAYDNARIPEALIRAGLALDAPAFVSTGLETLDWLCRTHTAPEGHFRPTPTAALGRRYDGSAQFDQQPLEAAAAVDACAAAYDATGDARWAREARRAHAWFLGENDLGAAVAGPDGQCHDGLTRDGVNLNQGAESVLAFQLATAEMQRLARAAGAEARGDGPSR